jgi:hypothetical protein
MKQLRSPRRLISMWRRRKQAAAEHAVGANGEVGGAAGTGNSAFTATGLAIEEQIRKARGSSPEGLAIF